MPLLSGLYEKVQSDTSVTVAVTIPKIADLTEILAPLVSHFGKFLAIVYAAKLIVSILSRYVMAPLSELQ